MHNSSCNLENLSEYLLMALFKSQHAERTTAPNTDLLLKDLYLTLDWNCPHVASNEVLHSFSASFYGTGINNSFIRKGDIT